MRRIAVILLIAVAGATPAASLAQNVGQATRVHSGSVQQSGTQVARLSTGDAIVWQARLGTDGTGSTEVTFADGTRLSMGPESDVVVDDFVYAPGASQQRMAVNLTKGFLRMISGDIRKDDVRIATPVAALGIRGTDFTLDLNVPDLLRIWLEEGAIFVVPADTGLVFEYAAPARVDCTRNACRLIAQTPVPRAFATAPGRGTDDDRNQPDGGGGGAGGGNSRN